MQTASADLLAANVSFLFTEWAYLDRFAVAAEAGFRAVEFLFPYDYQPDVVARRCREAGVEVALFNAPAGNWAAGERGLAALPGREDEFRAGIDRALEYAEALGVARLHVMAGIAEPDDGAAAACYAGNLVWAAEAASRRGVRVLVEPINGLDMPGYFLRDFAQAAAVVGDGRAIGLQFDLYHCQRLHGEVMPWLRRLLPVTGHLQIAGVPGRNEPAEPGLPLMAIFGLLRDAGYAGRVGCEYRPEAGTVAGLKWIERVEESWR